VPRRQPDLRDRPTARAAGAKSSDVGGRGLPAHAVGPVPRGWPTPGQPAVSSASNVTDEGSSPANAFTADTPGGSSHGVERKCHRAKELLPPRRPLDICPGFLFRRWPPFLRPHGLRRGEDPTNPLRPRHRSTGVVMTALATPAA
jgi:hypothetical protein